MNAFVQCSVASSIIAAIGICGPVNALAQKAGRNLRMPQAEPATQKEIHALIDAAADWGWLPEKHLEAANVYRHVEQLRRIENDAAIVQQLVLYAVEINDASTIHLIDAIRSLLQVSRADAIAGIAPMLGNSDAKINRALTPFVKFVQTDYDSRVGLLEWATYVQANPQRVSSDCVRHVFRHNPGRAALAIEQIVQAGSTLANREEPYSLREAAYLVDDANFREQHLAESFKPAVKNVNTALSGVAKRTEWWVQLFVAECLRQHPFLRTDELLATLEANDHPLVKESVAAIKSNSAKQESEVTKTTFGLNRPEQLQVVPAIQEKTRIAVEAIARWQRTRSPGDAGEAYHHIDVLGKSADKRVLVAQMVYFVGHSMDSVDPSVPQKAAGMLEINEADVVAAIAPVFDSSNPIVTKGIAPFLQFFEGRSEKDSGTHEYAAYIKLHPGDASAALIRHAFERSAAGMAEELDKLLIGECRREVTEAVYLVRDAIYRQQFIAEISTSSKREAGIALNYAANLPEWWVQLFVAETIRKHPFFRTDALLNKVKKSDHPLVKEAVAAIESDMKN